MKDIKPRKPRLSKSGAEVIQVPLYVGATSPFTLVTFDEGDQPSFTLEEVNNCSYDRLKLCRTTTTLDPKLSAMDRMAVIVSYTGALLFPRMSDISGADVLASANRILLKLTFGGIDFDAMAPNDIGFGFIYGTGYFLVGGGAVGPNFQTLTALQYQDAGSSDTMRLLSPRVRKSSEIHTAIDIGTPAVDGIPEISPNIFLNGLTYFRQGQLAPALVFLWSTCESLVGRLWNDHVVPKGAGISGRKRFIEGNGWQAAHMIELLYQTNVISDNLYAELNIARTARNHLSHRGTSPKLEECKGALRSAFKLVSTVRSAGKHQDEFEALADRLASAHDPRTGPLDPKYWREIPSVPGDEKWEGEYPQHQDIELVPIESKDAKRRPRRPAP